MKGDLRVQNREHDIFLVEMGKEVPGSSNPCLICARVLDF